MGAAKNILLIEDDVDLCASLTEWFKTYTYQVVTANDGGEGIRKSKNQHFDVIICDIGLPKVRGEEVVESIKRDSVNKDVPIIIISGSIDKNVLEKVRGKTVKAFVKPFEAEALVEFVKKILG